MTALSRLRDRLGEPMTELELVVLNSNNETAASQLEELYEEVRASGKTDKQDFCVCDEFIRLFGSYPSVCANCGLPPV